jgi:hypothetical protein
VPKEIERQMATLSTSPVELLSFHHEAGDYVSGPNHVPATGGVACPRGGLSAAPSVTTPARAEGLEADARPVEVRLAD